MSHINRVAQEKYVLKIQINLIKLKLTLMSILFWPETQIVDLGIRKNSYIGATSQVMPAVMLAGGSVAVCCR